MLIIVKLAALWKGDAMCFLGDMIQHFKHYLNGLKVTAEIRFLRADARYKMTYNKRKENITKRTGMTDSNTTKNG